MIYKKIKDMIIGSMKKNNKEAVSFLRYIDANVQSLAMDKRIQEPTDELVISVLQKEQKKITEELGHYKEENETTAKLKFQSYLIQSILPQEIPEGELSENLDKILSSYDGDVSMKSMGDIIKTIDKDYSNGKILNKGLLSKLLRGKISC